MDNAFIQRRRYVGMDTTDLIFIAVETITVAVIFYRNTTIVPLI